MHEPTQPQRRKSPKHRVKTPQRLDLKAVYAILAKAYFRNQALAKENQPEFKEPSRE